MSGRRILIAGGAGCLGSSLVEHLLPKGDTLVAIDNFATGKRAVLPRVDGLTVIEGSIADATLVDSVFADHLPTHVVHSAASYKDPSAWHEDTATNVLGTVHLIRASQRVGVRRFLNFQTALCYGRPAQVPIQTDHPVAPFTSYGISKVAGEQYVMAAELPAVSLRLANVCGPRLAIGPIPTFYKRLKAGQSCFCSDTVRDFLDMSDFLRLVDLALTDDAPCGVFHGSSGIGHSIRDVFVAVAAFLGLEAPETPQVPAGADDVPVVVLDPGGTERAFGWRPQVGFAETIRRQLAWYDRHGVTDIYSHLAPPS